MVKTRKGALSLLLALALCLGLMSPAIAAEEMDTQPETGSTWEKETQPETDSAEEKDAPSETGLAGEEDTQPETGSAGDPQPEAGLIEANEAQLGLPEAQEAEPQADENIIEYGNFKFDTATGTITRCDKSVTEVVIPDTISGVSVTSIGYSAFSNCTSLTSVTIPSSVNTIKSSAFEGCSALTSVNIPSSVTSIGSSAFKGCTNLREINIPDSVEVIESYAFQDCRSLLTVTIPEKVTSIGSNEFSGCYALTSVMFKGKITSIGHWAFSECYNLKDLTLPDTLTKLGSFAFENCSSLTELTIPKGITSDSSSFGGNVFSGCTGLTSVTIQDGAAEVLPSVFNGCTGLQHVSIPGSVTSIGSNAFSGCTNLKEITIPNSVTSIGHSAFSSCQNLSSLDIPSSVTSIGSGAFSYCSKLKIITIPDGITSIETSTFHDCTGLTEVNLPDTVTSIGNRAFYFCTSLTSITIPESVTIIESGAFESCTGLTSINIPKSVTSIGEGAFRNCPNLKNVTVSEGNTKYCVDNGILYDIGKTEILLVFAAAGKVDIPYGVTVIAGGTFSGLSELTEVTLPSSVTSIGDSAFAKCSNLTAVSIPDSVKSIGQSAFSYCTSLKSISIPDSVTSLGNSVFFHCGSLTEVRLPNAITSIGRSTFDHCTSLKSIAIPKSVTSIGDMAFQNCASLSSVDIPDGVTTIGVSAFSDCTSLTHVTVPASVTRIDQGAFTHCSSQINIIIDPENENFCFEDGALYTADKKKFCCLAATVDSFAVPSGVTTIEGYAFHNHRDLNSVTIPEGVTEIGVAAFWYCTSLSDVTLPNSLRRIVTQAFFYCPGLTSIVIPHGVTTIEQGTFRDCANLASVYIPGSVTEIQEYAFLHCSSLSDVYFTGDETKWKQIARSSVGNEPLLNAAVHLDSVSPANYTVTFDPNGGTSSMTGMTVTAGRPYGLLPSATRSGKSFEGWYTAPEGGKRITAATIVDLTADQTLYAHWGDSWLTKMTYLFLNSGGESGFNYTQNYQIPYARYITMFGDTVRAQQLFQNAGYWGGSCFGMSTTSAMFSQEGNSVSVKDFNSSANMPYDLTIQDKNSAWNLSTRDFIEAMQVSWGDSRINSNNSKNHNNLDALCRAVESFLKTGENPPVVTIYGTSSGGLLGGHAMLCYDLVSVSDTESRLKVYDPNYPNEDRHITLTKSGRNYTAWSYHLNNTYNWGTNDTQGFISYVPYADFYEVWTSRPGSRGRAASNLGENEQSALLIFNSNEAQVYDRDGNVAATIKGGLLESNSEDIFQMLPMGVLPEGESAAENTNTILFLPPDLYTVKDTGTSEGRFEATMVHVDQSATVVTDGDTVTFAVNDTSEVNYAKVGAASTTENAAYTVTMASMLTSVGENTDTVTVSGTLGQGDPSVTQLSGELFVENTANAEIKVNEEKVPAEELKDGASLDISKIVETASAIEAKLQADGKTVVLTNAPKNIYYVYAAAYNSKGQMTGIINGTLRENSTVIFNVPVAKGSQLFLLNARHAPLCARVTIR